MLELQDSGTHKLCNMCSSVGKHWQCSKLARSSSLCAKVSSRTANMRGKPSILNILSRCYLLWLHHVALMNFLVKSFLTCTRTVTESKSFDEPSSHPFPDPKVLREIATDAPANIATNAGDSHSKQQGVSNGWIPWTLQYYVVLSVSIKVVITTYLCQLLCCAWYQYGLRTYIKISSVTISKALKILTLKYVTMSLKITQNHSNGLSFARLDRTLTGRVLEQAFHTCSHRIRGLPWKVLVPVQHMKKTCTQGNCM